MNILILTSEYPYSGDPNPDRTCIVGDFAKKWVAFGHRVVVIVNSSSFPPIYYTLGNHMKKILSTRHQASGMPLRLWREQFMYNENGVIVWNLPMAKWIPHGAFPEKEYRKQIHRIQSKLTELDFHPDVITGHWVNPQLMLIPILGRHYNAKTAFVFHSDYLKTTCDKFHVQPLLDQIDYIGFRSQFAARAVQEYLSIKNPPFIAASGIPDSYILGMQNPRKKQFHTGCVPILTAGRLVAYKRIDSVIHAAADAFPEGNFQLRIAGDGAQRKQLERIVRSRSVSDNVHLIGRISRDALQTEMQNSDIFVLISQRETFGLVYLEAMLQGCIVIASRKGGMDGIIENGQNGFLCEEGNSLELAEIFRKINGLTKEEKSAISASAINTALHYSESAAAERYLKCITE